MTIQQAVSSIALAVAALAFVITREPIAAAICLTGAFLIAKGGA